MSNSPTGRPNISEVEPDEALIEVQIPARQSLLLPLQCPHRLQQLGQADRVSGTVVTLPIDEERRCSVDAAADAGEEIMAYAAFVFFIQYGLEQGCIQARALACAARLWSLVLVQSVVHFPELADRAGCLDQCLASALHRPDAKKLRQLVDSLSAGSLCIHSPTESKEKRR